MDARRFSGLVGIAWVAVTAVGVGMFVAAGPPPSFGESTAYANFTSASGGLFLADAFTTGISAALLLAFFVGLSAVLGEAVGKASLTEILVFGYGVATAALLALVGLFETVTVYVGRTPAHSAFAAPLWMLTQTTITFLYFFGVGAIVTLRVAILKTRVMPSWVGQLCAITAVFLALGTLFTLGGTGQIGPLGLPMVLVGFLPAAVTFFVLSVVLVRSVRG